MATQTVRRVPRLAPDESREPLSAGAWLARHAPEYILERFEVIDGRYVEKEMAVGAHGRTIAELVVLIAAQAPRLTLATDVGVWLREGDPAADDPDARPQRFDPDLVGVHTTNPVQLGDEQYRGVPDLFVEVLSRSTRHTDRGRKMEVCAARGVPYFWLADPRTRIVEAFRLNHKARAYVPAWTRPLERVEVPDDLR
jgi:Uma2 family endonuclease